MYSLDFGIANCHCWFKIFLLGASSHGSKIATKAKKRDFVTRMLKVITSRLFALTILRMRCCYSLSHAHFEEDRIDEARTRSRFV